jgi:hypothetical protein
VTYRNEKQLKTNDKRSSSILGFFWTLEFVVAVIVGVGVLIAKLFF